MTRIGWYVHHHGGGHLARMLSILPQLDAEVSCFSSLPTPPGLPAHCSWTVLERDDHATTGSPDPTDADPAAGGLLHWAPLGHPGHRNRLSVIVASLAHRPVDAFVVDVSVEVTLLARLLGHRTVVFAQPGIRSDAPHQLGYRAATTIIAPWPQSLLESASLTDSQAKVIFTGGISRFEHRMATAPVGTNRRGDGAVLALGGRGGADVTRADIERAAAASGEPWTMLGATADAEWRDDPWEELLAARVVVSWAGQNAIADIAAANAAAVVIPQTRPFSEQHETARALARAGLAVVSPQWPADSAWPALIEQAADLQPDWSLWEVAGATQRAADAIMATAALR